MGAKKDKLGKKRTKRDTESDSESYQSSSTDLESESSSSSDSDADSGHDVHEEQPPQHEIRSKRKNDCAVVGSNEHLNITQLSVVVPDLGRDDSGNVAVEGPVVLPSQLSQKEKEVLQANSQQHKKTNDAEVEVPLIMENVVPKELQPEPLAIITCSPIQPEQPSKSPEVVVESVDAEVEVPAPVVKNVVHEEIQPEPLVIIIPLEPELTLRPWLQPEAESANEVITTVLLSMNQEGPSSRDGKQIQQPSRWKIGVSYGQQ
ncbi:hypothetical protein PIB30_036206 [Stylosanthes scabra]|uniref:Uncharacterized protein n=1 Tax=Stylosanthes scabra TaxID=79078 RepID=A0ABU6TFA1_9FABA|nr:hypothetical protein [Stylosanthes scabra]